jgi:hypothetical protein
MPPSGRAGLPDSREGQGKRGRAWQASRFLGAPICRFQ